MPSNLYCSLLLSKFEQNQIFIITVSQGSSLEADYVLESRIDSFEEIVVGTDGSFAKIYISVNFIDAHKNQIIAHKIFDIKEKIERKDIHATYEAFQKALNRIGNDIVLWVNYHL